MGNSESRKKKGVAVTPPVVPPAPTQARSANESIQKIKDIGWSLTKRAPGGIRKLGDQYAHEMADILETLESRYGVLASSPSPVEFDISKSTKYYGQATYGWDGTPKKMTISGTRDYHAKNAAYQHEVKTKWKMPSNMTGAQYTVAHEYGHLLQGSIIKRAGKGGNQGKLHGEMRNHRSAILDIAKKKYGATASDMSGYGKTHAAEFFAEAFANAVGGSPNAIGKAMNDWLKTQGL